MFTVFILGNIASGKSSAARYLEQAGALHLDLDQMAKDLYQPGAAVVQDLVQEFCFDILDENGSINRSVLARKAFSSPELTAQLNSIVHPYLLQQLGCRLVEPNCCCPGYPRFKFAVVEVSAPDGFDKAFDLADEVMTVTAPLDVRRGRAIGRGMSADDFDRRSALQSPEDALVARADTVIDNSAEATHLKKQLDTWLIERGFASEGHL